MRFPIAKREITIESDANEAEFVGNREKNVEIPKQIQMLSLPPPAPCKS